jgi:hypothetical protein
MLAADRGRLGAAWVASSGGPCRGFKAGTDAPISRDFGDRQD